MIIALMITHDSYIRLYDRKVYAFITLLIMVLFSKTDNSCISAQTNQSLRTELTLLTIFFWQKMWKQQKKLGKFQSDSRNTSRKQSLV